MILVTWYLYHTVLQYVLLCSVTDRLSFSFWLPEILNEKEIKDSRQEGKKKGNYHLLSTYEPNIVQMFILVQSSQQSREVGISPILHMRNQFSDNVDCLLNFSVDINFHLFTFILPMVEILAAVH